MIFAIAHFLRQAIVQGIPLLFGSTGEIINDIILGDEGKVAYFPANSVIKDSKGNICICTSYDRKTTLIFLSSER